MNEKQNNKGKEKTMFKITGNTYDHKDQIKNAGGRWNREEKCWEIESVDDLVELEGLTFEDETDRFVITDGQHRPVREIQGEDRIFDRIVKTSGWKDVKGGRAVVEILESHGVDPEMKFYTVLYTGVREDGLKIDRTLAYQKMVHEMDEVNRVFDETNSKF